MNILLDFDGTLFDYKKALVLVMKQICREIPISYTCDIMKTFGSITDKVWEKYKKMNR